MPRIQQNETTKTIYGAALERNIPKLAKRWKVDPGVLYTLAERFRFRCAVCQRAFSRPLLYRVDGEPRGIICGYCESALRAIDYDPFRAATPRIGAKPAPRKSQARRHKDMLEKPLGRPRRFRYREPSKPKPKLLWGRWTKEQLRRLFILHQGF